MAVDIHLSPDTNRFPQGLLGNEAGKDGELRRQFCAMLEEAEAEADRDGSIALETVLAEIDAIVNSTEE